jgi:hypothetical protein
MEEDPRSGGPDCLYGSRNRCRFSTTSDASIAIADSTPDTAALNRAIAGADQVQRQLWSLAGQAVDAGPLASAPRLYIESLATGEAGAWGS